MSYISFYRKHRPQKFSDIVGQEHIIQTLQNSIIKNKISHSYIFCGPRGTGKTSLARIFAKAINCENGPAKEPCNTCANCLSITSGVNVDVIEIDAASNRGIDDIRELRDKVKYLPINLRKKVYIIDEAHQITAAASNAFLKVLEEPPEHVVFILATTEPHEVISTIMSRCQRFDFEPIPAAKIKNKINEIAKSENINITGSAIELIAKHADGSLRDANGILEQLSSFKDNKITVDDVSSLLGIIDFEILFELTNIIYEKNFSQAILFIHRVLSSGLNLKMLTIEYLEHLYNLFVIKNYDRPFDILDITDEAKERYLKQAALLTTNELNHLINNFTDLLNNIKYGDNVKVFFKTAILKAVEAKQLLKPQLSGKELDAIGNKNVAMKSNEINLTEDKTLKNTKQNKEGNDILEFKNKTNILNNQENNIKIETKNNLNDDAFKVLENKLKNNWNEFLIKLKNKNISIHAMFIETRGFMIKNNTLIFYFDSKKKWHKDHLSKINNLKIIQEVINSLIGNNLKIAFELYEIDENNNNNYRLDIENVNKNDINLNNFNTNINSTKTNLAEKENSRIKLENISNIKAEKNNYKKENEGYKVNSENNVKIEINNGEDDIFEYIEKKFKITSDKKIIKN